MQVFSEDAHMAVKEVDIKFLRCKYGGFVDFPKWPNKKIMEVKYILYGPVLPSTVTKSQFEISEDDEAFQIYKEMKLSTRRT